MTDQNPSPTTRMPIPDGTDSGSTGDPATSGSGSGSDWTTTSATATTTPPATPPLAAAPPPVAAPAPPVDRRPRRDDRDRGRSASILFGLIVLGLGLWFFAEQTLGYELPRISWSQVWPLFIIGIGVWVVLGSLRRGSR